MNEKNPEECLWRPKAVAYDLSAYVIAARSVYAYRICSTNYQESEISAIYKDEATQKALDALHKNDYNIDEALHTLMKTPHQEQKKWTDEDTKAFVKGLRKWEKNFWKIRKELLPNRTTAELIEFYYLWKKTQGGSKLMKSMRKQTRRPTNLVRRMRGRPNRTGTLSADYVDLNPSSDDDRGESEDSDKDLASYQCTNCSATESKDWHPTTKDKTAVLCSDCRLFYKKYGELRPTEDRENSAANGKGSSEEEVNENVNTSNGPAASAAAGKNGPTTRRANNSVGRSKSGNTSPETVGGDKSIRSPGNASNSSGGSANGDQKQPKKTRGGKASVSNEPSTEPVPDSGNSTSLPGRKRRKTSASESRSESSPNGCDASHAEDLVLNGESGSSERQNKFDFSTAPATTPSLLCNSTLPPFSLPAEFYDARLAALSQISHLKPSIKIEPGFELQVKSPGLIKSPKSDIPLASVKSEPTIPVGVVLPMQSNIGKQLTSAPVTVPKTERSGIKSEKKDTKDNFKHEIKQEIEVVNVDDSISPVPDPEPKADHAEFMQLKHESKLIRVWNRGEFNSCARTDLTYSNPNRSGSRDPGAKSNSTSSGSSSKPQIKSPAPVKDGKRPGSSQQSATGERERDTRSGTTASVSASAPVTRIADTPPRISMPSRHPGISPHGPEMMMHPGMQAFGQMSPMMFEQQHMLRLQQNERDREIFLRSNSVPPALLPGANMDYAQMMNLQRQFQANPMLMNMYPNLNPPGLAMMNEQHQREAAALMERAAMEQRHALMPSSHNPGGPPHMHGMHPDMSHEQALFHYMSGGGGGNPSFRGPFMGGHPGASRADMMHPLARNAQLEQEYMAAAQAQVQHAQAMQIRQMEEQHARMQFSSMMNPMNSHHPDFMR